VGHPTAFDRHTALSVALKYQGQGAFLKSDSRFVFTRGGRRKYTYFQGVFLALNEAQSPVIPQSFSRVFIQAAGGLSSTLIRARSPHEWLPKGADLILNKASGAPGFWIGSVIVMAGVPSIMQAMLDEVDPPSHALGNRARIRARRRHRNATRRDRPSIDNNGCSKGLRSNSLARPSNTDLRADRTIS